MKETFRASWVPTVLVLVFEVFRASPRGVMVDSSLPYRDLRVHGAICDGTTNVTGAVAAAIAAGYKRLYLPANCLYNPPSNTVPNGVDIMGEDLSTSKVWATTPGTNFLVLGTNSTLSHLNVNGKGCLFSATIGCTTYLDQNQDDTNAVDVQSYPYSYTFDVGHRPGSSGVGLNAVTVLQRGDGGGIYGQFNGGVDGSAGSGIQAAMAYNGATGQGLDVTQLADGIGQFLSATTNVGSAAGGTCCLRPEMIFSDALKAHGDNLQMYQAVSTWDGNGIFMNFGASAGTYTGNFLKAANAGTTEYQVTAIGNETRGWLDGVTSGAPVASAGVIAITGQEFAVTGAAVITTITNPNPIAAGNGMCIHLLSAALATWTIAIGGNIAAAHANPGIGHQLELCYDPTSTNWYPGP